MKDKFEQNIARQGKTDLKDGMEEQSKLDIMKKIENGEIEPGTVLEIVQKEIELDGEKVKDRFAILVVEEWLKPRAGRIVPKKEIDEYLENGGDEDALDDLESLNYNGTEIEVYRLSEFDKLNKEIVEEAGYEFY